MPVAGCAPAFIGDEHRITENFQMREFLVVDDQRFSLHVFTEKLVNTEGTDFSDSQKGAIVVE